MEIYLLKNMAIPTFILGNPGEKNEKQTIWNDIASVSLIKGHPLADKCYGIIKAEKEADNEKLQQPKNSI
jgi:hypothetical protein